MMGIHLDNWLHIIPRNEVLLMPKTENPNYLVAYLLVYLKISYKIKYSQEFFVRFCVLVLFI